jgi:hypothetical protein
MTYPLNPAKQQRAEFVRDAKGAVKQGTTLEKRAAAREVKADRWADWFHIRIDKRGGTPSDHLPDALAELEERIADQISGGIRDLKMKLLAGLK